jgi:hypothetical protein
MHDVGPDSVDEVAELAAGSGIRQRRVKGALAVGVRQHPVGRGTDDVDAHVAVAGFGSARERGHVHIVAAHRLRAGEIVDVALDTTAHGWEEVGDVENPHGLMLSTS